MGHRNQTPRADWREVVINDTAEVLESGGNSHNLASVAESSTEAYN